MPDHRTRLAKCFAAVFPDLPADEVESARPENVAGWDSVANVTLLAVVEEEFGVTVAPDDIEHLGSFAALLAYVRSAPCETSEPL